jgi:hypothetical protein
LAPAEIRRGGEGAVQRFDEETVRALREESRGRFTRYAREVVAPALGAEPASASLEPAVRGLGSLVFFLGFDGLPPLVLRGERGRRGLSRRIGGHGLLARCGVLVPEVRFTDLRLRTRWRWGAYFMVETRIGGIHLDEHPEPERAAGLAGRAFARVHDADLDAVGRPRARSWPWERVGAEQRRRSRKWLRRLYKTDKPRAERIFGWLHDVPAATWDQPARLLFGDIAPNNVLAGGDRAGLIDLSGIDTGFATFELVRSREKLLGGDALYAAFLRAYLSEAGPALRDETLRALPLAEVLFCLRQLGRKLDDGRRRRFRKRLDAALEHDPRAPMEASAAGAASLAGGDPAEEAGTS